MTNLLLSFVSLYTIIVLYICSSTSAFLSKRFEKITDLPVFVL